MIRTPKESNKCEDNELNSILLSNCVVAQFHLNNFRWALNDAEEALKFDPDNEKAMIRMFGNEPPSWDVNHKVDNISVGYQSLITGEMVKIDSNKTLRHFNSKKIYC